MDDSLYVERLERKDSPVQTEVNRDVKRTKTVVVIIGWMNWVILKGRRAPKTNPVRVVNPIKMVRIGMANILLVLVAPILAQPVMIYALTSLSRSSIENCCCRLELAG